MNFRISQIYLKLNKQVYLEEGKTQTSQVLKNKFVSATWKEKNICKK